MRARGRVTGPLQQEANLMWIKAFHQIGLCSRKGGETPTTYSLREAISAWNEVFHEIGPCSRKVGDGYDRPPREANSLWIKAFLQIGPCSNAGCKRGEKTQPTTTNRYSLLPVRKYGNTRCGSEQHGKERKHLQSTGRASKNVGCTR